MTNRIPLFIRAATALAAIAAAGSPALAQTTVAVDVKVLELSRAELDRLQSPPLAPIFALKLTGDAAKTLTQNPAAKIVHSLDLKATSGQATQFGVNSRVADDLTYFDIGIGLDVTPKVFQNRDIAIVTSSQVRIRQNPDGEGRQRTVFENPPIGNETRIHEGESILLGGFITDPERGMLPPIAPLPDNSLLNYLFSKKRGAETSELVVLLTPRITGALINASVESAPLPVTAKAPLPAPKPPIEVQRGPVYAVQVGAFERSDKADSLVVQLSKKYESVFIDKLATTKTPYHVRVGRLSDISAARDLQRKLAVDGYDTFVIVVD